MGDTIREAVQDAVTAHSTPETPAATPSSTPATPAPREPVPASLPGTPASAAVAAADPSKSTPPGAATTQPVDPDAALLGDKGWLTLDARRKILDNARDKAASQAKVATRQETLREFGVSSDEEVAQLLPHVRSLLANPVEYYRSLGQSLQVNGLLPPEAANQPAPASTPPKPKDFSDFKLPPPTYQTADGKGLVTVDDVKAAFDDMILRVQGYVEDRLSPHEERAQRSDVEALRAKAVSSATTDIETARQTWPRFKDCQKRIAVLMREAVTKGDPTVTLRAAYNHARLELEDSERPGLEETIRKRVMQDINKAPVDPVSTVPGATVPHGARAGRRGDLYKNAVRDAVSTLTSR